MVAKKKAKGSLKITLTFRTTPEVLRSLKKEARVRKMTVSALVHETCASNSMAGQW